MRGPVTRPDCERRVTRPGSVSGGLGTHGEGLSGVGDVCLGAEQSVAGDHHDPLVATT